MKILAWDTSSATGIVAAGELLVDRVELRSEWVLSLQASRHSERLLWTIDTVLKACGWKLDDVHAIAAGVGPGSFTGLRIGIITAKSLALALNKKIIAVSSLEVWLQPSIDFLNVAGKKTSVLCVTDATKGESFFRFGKQEGVADLSSVADRFDNFHANSGNENWMLMGGDAVRILPFIKSPLDQRIILPDTVADRITGLSLLNLAKSAVNEGLWTSYNELRPNYLRASDAEVKLKKGLLKPSKKGTIEV